MEENVLPTKRKRRTVVDLTEDVEDEPNYSIPSSDQRYRPFPSFLAHTSVERLAQEPRPLTQSTTTPTRNGSDDANIADKVARAWAKNFGPGPTWELMEDRSWFKESYQDPNQFIQRALVHSSLEDATCWQEIPPNEASVYLPRGLESNQVPEISCAFGPFEKQVPLKLRRFDSLPISTPNLNKTLFTMDNVPKKGQIIENKESHVIFAGGPVWSLDWCPLSPDFLAANGYKEYLAVAPLRSPSQNVVMTRPQLGPLQGSIQIWTYSRDGEDKTRMTCDLVLCIDSGVAVALQWCPLPCHQEGRGRLGLLASVFEDGSLQIFGVPIPEMTGAPKFVRLGRPCVSIKREDLTFTCLDWANSDLLALGCSNGCILVFSFVDALQSDQTAELAPLSHISVHQSIVRSVSWVAIPPVKGDGSFATDKNPNAISSVAFDGVLAYTDITEQASYMINRIRETLHAVSYSVHNNAMVASDGDTAKAFATVPTFFGKRQHILETMGPILSIGTSDYHPYVAVGSADGICQTTNMAKNPRRRVVPYFVYQVFQLDYSRTTREYRMLENFIPHESVDRGLPTKNPGKGRGDSTNAASGAWSPEVAVTCTRWNEGCGIGQATLLASATASGLCRVDWLGGRFHGDRVPFGSIEAIRGEVREEVAGGDIENVE